MKGPVCYAKAAELSSVGNREAGKRQFLLSHSGSSVENRKDQRQDQKQAHQLGGRCNSPGERRLGFEQRGCIGTGRKRMGLSLRLEEVLCCFSCFALLWSIHSLTCCVWLLSSWDDYLQRPYNPQTKYLHPYRKSSSTSGLKHQWKGLCWIVPWREGLWVGKREATEPDTELTLAPAKTGKGRRTEWQSQCITCGHSAPNRSAVKSADLNEQILRALLVPKHS